MVIVSVPGHASTIRVPFDQPTIQAGINVAGSNGGAISYGYSPTQGVIRNCVFYGNTAPYRGGGIAISGCAAPNVGPVIRDCVLYDNSVTAPGSSTQGGGGIHTASPHP